MEKMDEKKLERYIKRMHQLADKNMAILNQTKEYLEKLGDFMEEYDVRLNAIEAWIERKEIS